MSSEADRRAERAVRDTLADLLLLFEAPASKTAAPSGWSPREIGPRALRWWAGLLRRHREVRAPQGRSAPRRGWTERVGLEALLLSGRVPETLRQEVLAVAPGPEVLGGGGDRDRCISLAADWMELLETPPVGEVIPRIAHPYYGALDTRQSVRLAQVVIADLRARAGL